MSLMLGTKLADLRKRHGYSQEALAEKMGVSRQAVSKWERGESTPDTDTLIELAKLYDASLDELVGHEKTNKENKDEPKANKTAKKAEASAPSYKSLSSKLLKFPFPLVVAAVYVLLGITQKLWHPLWLIFLMIPAYYHMAIGLRAKTKKGLLLGMPVFEASLVMFLLLGFYVSAWSWAWILFIGALCYYWGVAVYVKKNKE